MKHFRLPLCMLCATIMLSGCSSLDSGETVSIQNNETVNVDLMNGMQDVVNAADYASAPLSLDRDGVEIYSLDGTFPPVNLSQGNQGLEARVAPSVVSYSSPGVQIFTLDGRVVRQSTLAPVLRNPNPPAAPAVVADVVPASAPAVVVEAVEDITEVDVDAAPEDSNTVRVYFDHNASDLDQESIDQIALLVQQINEGHTQDITVEGHSSVRANYTDEVQRKMTNLKVSMDRALSVVRFLVERGVPAESIRTVAWGETHPSDVADGKDEEAASRRVEIITK